MDEVKNISCNIFLEQIELIEELPKDEKEKVLYLAIMNAFDRAKNQIENQIDYQNENTYISISKSLSLSKYLFKYYENLSKLSKSVFNLLSKTIICKEYSKNYGGKRVGAGRPKLVPINKNNAPTKDEIIQECKIQARKINIDEFYDYWDKSNWLDKSGLPINWRQKIVTWALREKQEPQEKKVVHDGLF